MKIEEIHDCCTGCGACMSECPKKCIEFKFDDEGFYFPSIDKNKCIECGRCERVCHILNPLVHEDNIEANSYYGYSLDRNIRAASSSGGVFSCISRNILAENGVVYGAAFDFDTLTLKHTSTDRAALSALAKSKYIESYMGNTIADIKNDLKNGRTVLFCGTPCQVAGVRNAVGENERLILCDFVCHGVPSARIFKEYLKGKLHKNEKLSELDFRPKDNGWTDIYIRLKTSRTEYFIPHNLDLFYKGFITENAFLRRSCYECRYRQNHLSDITIADFWGYRDYNPAISDNKGLSLIVTNNAKGKRIVESLENFELHRIDNRFSKYAFAAKDYSKYLELRSRFYSSYHKVGFKKAAMQTYMKGYHLYIRRVWRKIKEMYKHIKKKDSCYIQRLKKAARINLFCLLPSTTVLMFHHIDDGCINIKSGCKLSKESFLSILDSGIDFISMEEYAKFDFSAKNSCVITFDDALSDVFRVAYPELKKRRIPFTVFVITDFLNDDGYISDSELLEMAADPLVTIGSHGVTHEVLSGMSEEKQLLELLQSKEILQNLIGKEVHYFAYSHGLFDKTSLNILKEKSCYRLAFVAGGGVTNRFSSADHYILPRVDCEDGLETFKIINVFGKSKLIYRR